MHSAWIAGHEPLQESCLVLPTRNVMECCGQARSWAPDASLARAARRVRNRAASRTPPAG